MKQEPGANSPEFRKSKIDIVIIIALSSIVYLFSAKYDVLEKMITFAHRYEHWELDEFVSLSIFLMIGLSVFSVRRWREIKKAKTLLDRKDSQSEKLILTLKNEVESHQNSLKKIKSIYNAAPIGFGVTVEGIFQEVNDYYCQMTGYSRDELIGQHSKMVLDDSEKSGFNINAALELIKTKGTAASEVKHKRKDGQLFDVLLGFAPINPSNPLHGLSFIALDISDRKKLEAILLESEAKYRNLFTHDITGNFLIKADGTILDCNPAFARIFGYESNDELIGVNAAELYPYEDGKKLINRLRAEKKIEGIQIEFPLSDKRPLHCIGNLVGHFDAEGNMIHASGYYFDETKRVLMEKNLRQAQKMEAIGTLAGGIAHDFNNILTGMIGYTELALDEVQDRPSTKKELEQVLKAGRRASDLVKQILSFSRSHKIEAKPIKPATIAKEVVQLMRASLPSTIEIKHSITSKRNILADPTNFHQVLMNLCTNAGHAMKQKGGVLSISLQEVMLGQDDLFHRPGVLPGEYLKISVEDTGTGMTKDVQEKAFNPFFTTKEQGEGTGMGLSTVHGIITELGGFISLQSELKKGTVIHLFIPSISDAAEIETIPNDGTLKGGTERVLLVDDEEMPLDLTKEVLSRYGYRVTAFSDSTIALAHFKQNPYEYDLVITDMTMPKITGDFLTQKIHLERPDIPVIMSTGFSEAIDEQKAIALDIEALLYKPVIRVKLLETIRKVLDQSRKEKNS